MTSTLAEVVVGVAAAFVVETDPEPFFLLGHVDFQRFARLRTFLQDARRGFDQQRIGGADLARCEELGATIAAGLELGIY